MDAAGEHQQLVAPVEHLAADQLRPIALRAALGEDKPRVGRRTHQAGPAPVVAVAEVQDAEGARAARPRLVIGPGGAVEVHILAVGPADVVVEHQPPGQVFVVGVGRGQRVERGLVFAGPELHAQGVDAGRRQQEDEPPDEQQIVTDGVVFGQQDDVAGGEGVQNVLFRRAPLVMQITGAGGNGLDRGERLTAHGYRPAF